MTTIELTMCPDPDCGAPAEVVDRYTLESTSGPVPHAVTSCTRRHHYVTPDEVAGDRVAEPAQHPVVRAT